MAKKVAFLIALTLVGLGPAVAFVTLHAHRSYAIPSTLLCAEVQPASPDPVSFDASIIPAWTVADLFNRPPWVALIYHVMGTSYDFSPLLVPWWERELALLFTITHLFLILPTVA
jgi:hypothetical protein